ncbi:HpcH/HpaI aldolase/citrate lyase family protein [Futiania mangrovi]|uniref:CoA ester lyase n=1 Tax=Futiania mangrovi TaxID=2959716 RepID=A0A9J6PBU6_9PROT|nr:CoA ester lyase [Futiania mangrovii]MCP1336733.1 CoA ester lyase [Futiania mangrovii]
MTSPSGRSPADASPGGLPVLRSLLFVPGSRPDRFGKALAAGADAIIVDLEDAVAPAAKDEARDAVLAFLRTPRAPDGPKVLVRVNGVRSRTGIADLLALTAPDVAALWDGLMLPKIDAAGDVRLAGDLLAEAGAPGFLVALIETAEGLENVMEIGGASARLAALMFGGADLAADLRVPFGWAALVHARARVVHAAARHGLAAIEMPWIALDDDAGYLADVARSFELGFSARAAIHPKQIAPIHAALAPAPEEVAQARRIVEAYEAAGGAVCTLDGKLVERPVILGCQRILALAALAESRGAEAAPR